MEARLGADFSDVRLHTDTAARSSAAEVGARAYTSGEHVVIGSGGGDRHTLAHELTHVIQQRSGPVAGTPTGDGLTMSDPSDTCERAAEANARRVMAGGAPQVHDHAGDGHVRHARHPVQRMPLTQFQQQVGALANDPDFITFFEIRRGREDPAAVVNDSTPGSQNRLQQFVQHPDVTTALVTQYMTDYQQGATGTRRQPANLNQPMVVGLEMEMRNAVLQFEDGMANGQELAHTTAVTEAGPPVLKLVIEGMEPGDPAIELVYGPLPPDDYRSPALTSARNKLKTAIRKAGTISQLLRDYNRSLQQGDEQRYRLVASRPPRSKKQTGTPKFNTQTNVSTPYSKLGRTNAQPASDFGAFFERPTHRAVHARARTQAAALVTAITANWTTNHAAGGPLNPGINLASMLTHLLYQEAMYVNHELSREQVGHDDKHFFHVLLKLSPQDAVMTILTDDDAKLLLAWLVDTHAGPLADSVMTTFGAFNSPRTTVAVDAGAIYRYLVDVLVARLLAGQQLLAAADDQNRTSPVFGNAQEVGEVTHVHPRPSNRVPITTGGRSYFMVVEQRAAAHEVNSQAESNPRAAVEQMKNLQRPTR
ncbi:protein of unknown function [Lentzea fradiae]|uniref:eCIS core domain-containing protein n=2 Tax=Lentzea fradiae TaxID=200378 RepID=A0A1G8CLY0_9PSEU|nr:protein of unknown function [Lentzea fradiae]